jgi:hypothetical protein
MKSGGSPYGTVKISFHAKSGDTKGSIDFTTVLMRPTPLDVDTENEKSGVFALNLPVGDYLIDSLAFTDSTDLEGHNCRVQNKLSVPFSVKPAAVIYVGALLTSADWVTSQHKLPIPKCGYFVVQDQSARDQPALHDRFNNVPAPTEVQLLAGNTPEAEKFFRSK